MQKFSTLSRKIGSTPIFWGYLVLISGAELTTSVINAVAGMLFHLALVLVFVLHGALAKNSDERRLALALTVAPFIRLLSLSLPLVKVPQIFWYPMVSVPLLLGVWYVIRQVGFSRVELGLKAGKLPWQLMLAGGGLGLGVLEFAILRPKQILTGPSFIEIIFAAFSLAIFTGFSEELIFRGLLQSASKQAMKKLAPLYVSVLFGVLHIGYLSVLDVVFVTAVGLLFAYLVQYGGSILGVTLVHSLTNITLFIIMPFIVSHPPDIITLVFCWFTPLAVVASLVAAVKIWRDAIRPSSERATQSSEQPSTDRTAAMASIASRASHSSVS